MIKLSYIHSKDFVYNIERSLSLIKTEVTKNIKNKTRVVVKIDIPKGASNQIIEAPVLEALLSFITPHSKNQITVVGQSSKGNTLDTFKNFGYLAFQDYYDFAINDLNDEERVPTALLGQEILVPKILNDADYLIIISKPKITDGKFCGALTTLLTEGVEGKENIFDRILGRKKKLESISDSEMITNLFAQYKVGLSIIDGQKTILDKNGNQDILPTNFAISSTNPVEADVLAAMCLGFQPEDVDYLAKFNPNLSSVFVVGDDWNKYSLTPQN